MKKNLFIVAFCLFCFNISNGNSSNSFNCFENYQKATIHFLDGTSIKGYGKIVEFLKVYKVKFKASKESKPDTWTSLMVRGITFHINNENFEFEYVKVRKTTTPRLLELVEKGEVRMYVVVGKQFISYDLGLNPHRGGYWETSFNYFVKRKNELMAINFNGVINFKKTARAFFKDCDGIINRINSKQYTRNTIPEMVYYYNDFCAEIK